MAVNDLNLIIDVNERKLIRDFLSAGQTVLPPLVQGDTYNLRIRAVEANPEGAAGQPWREVDISGATVKAAVAVPGADLTSGTITPGYGGTDGAAVGYKPTAQELEDSLNGIAAVTSDGGLDVEGPTGGPFRVTWRSNGSRTALTFDASLVHPSANIDVFEQVAGDVSTREIQFVSIEVAPIAFSTSFSGFSDTAAITVTQIVAGTSTTNEIQKIQLSPIPYGGVYTLSLGPDSTGVLDYDATASDIQTAMGAAFNAIAQVEEFDCPADVSDSLDGTYFLLYDEDGSVGVWIDTDNSGTTIPSGASAAARAIEVTGVVTDDAAASVATAVASAINADSKFSATSDGATVTVTHVTAGKVSDATDGDTGITSISVTTNGADDKSGLVTVTGEFPVFYVEFLTANDEALMVGQTAGLLIADGMEGDLDLNTIQAYEVLAGARSVDAYLEIELITGGDAKTILQEKVTILDDAVPTASPTMATGY